mgnify:CR=1 FL=1
MDAQGNTTSRLAPSDDDGPVLSETRTAHLFRSDIQSITPLPCPRGIDLIGTPKNDPELSEIEVIPLDQALVPRRHIEALASQYDVILVDCPPSLGRKLVAALAFSTHVVCPLKLSGFAVDGIEGLLNTIVGVREEYNPGLSIMGLLINDMDRSVNHDRSLKDLQESVPELLFKTNIMHRPPLDSATTEGVPVWELRYGHVAAKEVIAAVEEIWEKAHD